MRRASMHLSPSIASTLHIPVSLTSLHTPPLISMYFYVWVCVCVCACMRVCRELG